MTFLDPWRLLLLLFVLAVAVIYIVMQRRRQTYSLRFTNIELLESVAPNSPGFRRHVPAVLFLLAAALSVVGFARPARATDVARERATVILAIDTSLSMDAADVIPSRIAGAKIAAEAFLETVPGRINIGLVSFHGIANVRVAPTLNRAAINSAIDSLELGEATAIGEAIFASLQTISAQLPDAYGTPPPARIVLMSDGMTTVGRPDALAVEAARNAGVSVSTIAFGTRNGVIDVPGEGLIEVPVDHDALAKIAEGTGGQFFAAASTSELEAIYADLGSSIGFEEEQQEIILWFIGPALLLLLATSATSLLWFSRLP